MQSMPYDWCARWVAHVFSGHESRISNKECPHPKLGCWPSALKIPCSIFPKPSLYAYLDHYKRNYRHATSGWVTVVRKYRVVTAGAVRRVARVVTLVPEERVTGIVAVVLVVTIWQGVRVTVKEGATDFRQ